MNIVLKYSHYAIDDNGDIGLRFLTFQYMLLSALR